jgi:hypothetical protein
VGCYLAGVPADGSSGPLAVVPLSRHDGLLSHDDPATGDWGATIAPRTLEQAGLGAAAAEQLVGAAGTITVHAPPRRSRPRTRVQGMGIQRSYS